MHLWQNLSDIRGVLRDPRDDLDQNQIGLLGHLEQVGRFLVRVASEILCIVFES